MTNALRRSGIPAAIFSLASLLPLAAHAVWQAVPEVELRAASQDNPRLAAQTGVQDSATSTVLDARVNLSTFNERGFASFEPRIQSHVYGDRADGDLEGDDWYLDGRGEYRWQVVTIGFRSNYRRRAIVRAELLDIDDPVIDPDGNLVDDPDAVDSGRLGFIDQDQERFTLTPYMDFRLSERSAIRLQLSSTEVSYTQGNTATRTGFDNRSLEAGVVRRVNEQSQVSAMLVVSEFKAEANNNSTETIGVRGEIRRTVSDLWTVNINAGVERSEYIFDDPSQNVVDNAAANFTLGLRATKRTERSTFDLGFQRLLNPNSSGFLTERNQLQASINRDLTQRLSARVGILRSESASIGASRLNDRDYARYSLSFDWAVRQRWTLTSGYNYTIQEFTRETIGETTSDMIYLGIGYRGLSRPGAPR